MVLKTRLERISICLVSVLSTSLLTGCGAGSESAGDRSSTGEYVSTEVATRLVSGVVVDAAFIRLATWNSVDNILLVEMTVKASDEIILLSNFDNRRGIVARQIYQEGEWSVEKTLSELGAVPCIVEAKSRARVYTLAVNGAPNCSDTSTNTLPIPEIVQPAATLTIRTGESLIFSATITDPDNNGPYTYYWNFASAALASAAIVDAKTHTTTSIPFNRSGNYAIIVRVTDATGEMSLTNAQRHILVIDGASPAPTPTSTPVVTPSPAPGISMPSHAIKQALGKKIFFDTNLSEPSGLACASCHHPIAGWADPDRGLSVSAGALGNFGLRNAPSTAYASQTPEFSGGLTPSGGLFWDGRAANLIEQAKISLLSVNQQANISRSTVVQKIKVASYAVEFEQVYGVGIFDNIELAFDKLADAIVAYETSAEMNPFNSKFDAVIAGRVQFTAQEQLGYELFNGKAYCSVCHSSQQVDNVPVLFSDFGYANLGLPVNNEFPFSAISPRYLDMGLGEVLVSGPLIGKFKMPGLRNVEQTAPYMHNGLLKTLEEVVHFYNTRDVPGIWPVAEVPENREQGVTIGNLSLSESEESAIVAFLKTLTDGFDSTIAGPPGTLIPYGLPAQE